MKRLLSYILTYKKSTTVALLLMLLELAVELAQPILMAIIIDKGVVERDLSTVIQWGSVLLAISLIAFIGGIVSSYFAADVSQGVGYDIRRDVYTKIQKFSTSHFQRFSTSSLITRLTNDVTQIQGFVFMSLRILLRAPLYVVIGTVMAFTVHVRLASILLIAVPISIAIMLWVVSKGVVYFRKVQEKLDSVNSVIRENLIGIRLVKAFNRGKFEDKRFSKVNQSLMTNNVKALRFMELALPIIMFGMNASLVIVLWFAASEIDTGGALPGEVVAILNYGTRILGAIGMFSFLLMNFSRGRASATRISEVLDEEDDEELNGESEGNRKKLKGEIAFQDVSFIYPDMSIPALRDISFHINPGETVGILGETGSGKSSLVQMIPRLFEPTAGHVLIDNQDILELETETLRKGIGLVPQEAHLFTGTIRENMKWGQEDATDEEIMEACKHANIHDFIMTLPNRYDTQIGQRGVNLSGGQKQRLSLARALVRKPKILLLDDSTSALDAHTEASILQELRQQECTTVIVAQKISSVVEADTILLLKEGDLIATGSHEELIKNNDFYRSIYYSQVQEEVLEYGDKE
jgi:ATP-binding cassette, subfamily B, multidrug efflux pump